MPKRDYFKSWLKTVKESSKVAYLSAWSILIEYYKDVKGEDLTPNDLLKRLIKDRKKPIEKRTFEEDINAWILWLENDYVKRVRGRRFKKKGEQGIKPKTLRKTKKKGIAANSIKAYMGAIRSFFTYYGYPLSKKVKLPRHIKLSNGKIENEKIEYRPEQVKKLLDVIKSPRDKAIVLSMFQSGMDISTACSLNYGDIKEELEAGIEPIMIHVVRPKVGLNYRTFIGHDSIEAIKIELNIRREKYKEKILFDTPLFVNEGTHYYQNAKIEYEKQTDQEIAEGIKKKIKSVILNDKCRMKPKNLQDPMREYVLLAGLVSKEKMERADLSPARLHGLRAGFSTIARLRGLNETLIDYFMGHTDNYGGAYNNATKQELKEKYLEIEPGLTVSTVSNMSDIEANLRKEIEKLRYENAGRDKEIKDLREDFSKLNQAIKELDSFKLIQALKKDPEIKKKLEQIK